ncbi:cupredoxin domain-containing protein [Streptomyces roseoverticillatus]|uniref:cupredoxin domain-containing protein n=1 Tax=Streptomyces roseoverticillatus TaxID=66429 RepID=UPI001F2E5510|nr:cupredoxin domain-containing protein [Streptomyces roseoverticillatus]MCF3102514.1 cupredoxin domain-containing protein [Streptomyces roseoverticillatus]
MPRSPARSLPRLLVTALTALSLSALLTGPAAPAAGTGRATTETTVVIEGFEFVPASVTIHAGDSVRWVNKDNDEHTTTSDEPGGWDSGAIPPGSSFTQSFGTPGTFPYHCDFHSSLTGKVVVE